MHHLKILYGSETGNAQDFAEHFWQIFRSNGIMAECHAMDDYPIECLCKEKMAIFIISTSGQGEVPTNMRNSWSFLLSKKLPENWLSNVEFALLGLGDSSYQKYNYAAKKFYRRLIQLGAKPILDLMLADEQHHLGIDEVYEKWSSRLIQLESFQRLPTAPPELANPYKFIIDFGAEEVPDSTKFFPLQLLRNDRLTAVEHFQDTRLITLSIEDEANNFRYSPGDILMVLPENLRDSIQIAKNSLLACQPFLQKSIYLCRTDATVPRSPQFLRLISSRSMRFIDCLHFYFDLQCIPKRRFIGQMVTKAEDELERERLIELASNEGIDDYLDYCVYSKRTIAEFLRDFPLTSALLTPAELFHFFPVIRPRAFSIASSPSANPGQIQILVARVNYNVRKMKEPRLGLCSNFLCDLVPGQKVFTRIRPGIFRVKGNEPLILVGPGTGVAPFRSMALENELASPGSQILLFFGCRGEFRDFYFENEWPEQRKTRFITAFSRDQNRKIYVQHRIMENAKEIWELINAGAKILIAGSSGEMPKQVVSAIKQSIISHGGIAELGADKFIEMLEKRKCIQYETWS